MVYVDLDNTLLCTNFCIDLYNNHVPEIDPTSPLGYINFSDKAHETYYTEVILNVLSWQFPCLNTIRYLINQNMEFTILTTRLDDNMIKHNVRKLLGKHSNLLVDVIAKVTDKLQFLKNETDVIIDDDPKVITVAPKIIVSVMPYNKHINTPNIIDRIYHFC